MKLAEVLPLLVLLLISGGIVAPLILGLAQPGVEVMAVDPTSGNTTTLGEGPIDSNMATQGCVDHLRQIVYVLANDGNDMSLFSYSINNNVLKYALIPGFPGWLINNGGYCFVDHATGDLLVSYNVADDPYSTTIVRLMSPIQGGPIKTQPFAKLQNITFDFSGGMASIDSVGGFFLLGTNRTDLMSYIIHFDGNANTLSTIQVGLRKNATIYPARYLVASQQSGLLYTLRGGLEGGLHVLQVQIWNGVVRDNGIIANFMGSFNNNFALAESHWAFATLDSDIFQPAWVFLDLDNSANTGKGKAVPVFTFLEWIAVFVVFK